MNGSLNDATEYVAVTKLSSCTTVIRRSTSCCCFYEIICPSGGDLTKYEEVRALADRVWFFARVVHEYVNCMVGVRE